jgi:2-oxoglutarate dehydrogenase E2 component (dihydrolipoamide succinyltransferase)
MPQFGESVIEGTITKWLKTKGEPVSEYEPLLEVNTDKVDTEIPSPASGVLLDILVGEGTTVKAGSLLAWIGENGESLPTGGSEPDPALTETETPTPAVQPAASAETHAVGRKGDLGFISPVVARMAAEHGIDLSQVSGTGQGGRITKKDVQAYLERSKVGVGADLRVSPPTPAPISPAASLAAPGEVLPLTQTRRLIAEHMVMSKHTSPHVTTVMEADMSRVAAHREANKASFARDGANLTFTAYFVAASVAALKAYPMVNSSWSDQGLVLHRQVHIGVAASLGEEGLIVPVIKNADSFSLLGLARAVNDLAERARAKKLQPDEVKGGTFTITNHGVSGSLFATPIINQPQCAILGVGVIQKRVVVINDAIAIRPMVYISLTFDHRILDGAMGDTFLNKVVETLQGWG